MTDTSQDATTPPDHDGESSGTVRLVVPAQARFLRLARLTAAGLAADLGYGVDTIEDVRIAVDELCAAVIDDADPGSELTVVYREVDGDLVVDGFCDDTHAPMPALHRVAQELLAMLADEYAVGEEAGRRFRLVTRSRSPR